MTHLEALKAMDASQFSEWISFVAWCCRNKDCKNCPFQTHGEVWPCTKEFVEQWLEIEVSNEKN